MHLGIEIHVCLLARIDNVTCSFDVSIFNYEHSITSGQISGLDKRNFDSADTVTMFEFKSQGRGNKKKKMEASSTVRLSAAVHVFRQRYCVKMKQVSRLKK